MPEPGAKVVSVSPERLERWLAGFTERHGAVEYGATAEVVTARAADGAVARCRVPFPPLSVDGAEPAHAALVRHALAERRVGVVLVRRGGYAAGVFEGRRLVVSKVGSRHVQGRTAAGGQSQQRFARRREKQSREAFEAAADVAVRIVLPHASSLDAVVVGGDRSAVAEVFGDRRLAVLGPLVRPPHLAVADPRLAVVRSTPDQFRAVEISLTEPAAPPA